MIAVKFEEKLRARKGFLIGSLRRSVIGIEQSERDALADAVAALRALTATESSDADLYRAVEALARLDGVE